MCRRWKEYLFQESIFPSINHDICTCSGVKSGPRSEEKASRTQRTVFSAFDSGFGIDFAFNLRYLNACTTDVESSLNLWPVVFADANNWCHSRAVGGATQIFSSKRV